MDVEKARVTGRAERLNAQAASFLTGRTNDVAERLFHGALVSRARMKTSEDEQLQASSAAVGALDRAPQGELAGGVRTLEDPCGRGPRRRLPLGGRRVREGRRRTHHADDLFHQF